jgi:hypothetical protein
MEQLSKEEVQMANKYIKKCLTAVAIKEMQSKMTLRFHLILVRMAIIKKRNKKCWQRCRGQKRTLFAVGGNIN